MNLGVQTLFTPWRYDYLTAPKTEQECIFCAASSSKQPDRSLTLYRNDHAVVMLNKYPYTNGHIMVAPIEHRDRLFDTSNPVLFTVIRLAAESQRILTDTYHPDGFNIGMNFGKVAGAGVADHYHVHVVPRWGGDANFMTVTAQTRMVPETLESTYQKLLPKFKKLKRDFSRSDD
jgi:ATP adenylyltransferase